ncbi:MAG: enoyl-CoA hydratase-related protein [Desulfomonilia bacterium]|nr:enoyl-CoA hydratase-related protein [Desulfomonilia bacterium]
MTEESILLTEIRSHVGTLTFNRPQRKNALSLELLVAIHKTLQEWGARDEVRVVVITGGSTTFFSSGYDIASIPTQMTPELEEAMRSSNPLEFALNSVAEYPYPTIAMMNGYAYGAGLNLAMCCDIRVAVDDISVGMPPAKLGLVYHPEGIRQFLEVIGMAKTREVFLSARTYRGMDARAMGLVDWLVPEEDLGSFTYSLADEIAANAPLSLKGTKRILSMYREQTRLTQDRQQEAERLMNEAFDSDDLKEGQRAFFEKRTPKFHGR